MSNIFFTLLHYKDQSVMSKNFMIITDISINITITKVTPNLTSFYYLPINTISHNP